MPPELPGKKKNASSKHMSDGPPRNSGGISVSKHQIQPENGDEQADAERDSAESVSRDQILRHTNGDRKKADHDQDWQPYPVYLYPCYL